MTTLTPPCRVLEFVWSTSKAELTYGFNICTLLVDGQKVTSTTGVGYDMKGTALGNWLEKEFQQRLLEISERADTAYTYQQSGGYRLSEENNERNQRDSLYGMYLYRDVDGNPTRVSLDGATGMESMRRILNAIGRDLRYLSENKKRNIYMLERLST